MDFLELALEQAQIAYEKGQVPVGAILVSPESAVVAKAHNISSNPVDHAEILAIRKACENSSISQNSQNTPRKLTGYTLYTTVEPCIMCVGAILNARIDRVVFASWDTKFGASGSVWDLLRDPRAPHHPEVIGPSLNSAISIANPYLSKRAATLMSEFFKNLRS